MTSTNKKTIKTRLKCPNCGSQNICLLEDETFCRECGLVLQGVPSIDHYVYGYIVGGKRLMYIKEEKLDVKMLTPQKKRKR